MHYCISNFFAITQNAGKENDSKGDFQQAHRMGRMTIRIERLIRTGETGYVIQLNYFIK